MLFLSRGSICYHLTFRYGEGWKLLEQGYIVHLYDLVERDEFDETEVESWRIQYLMLIYPHQKNVPVPRFLGDLKALETFDLPTHTLVSLHTKSIFQLVYDFGDFLAKVLAVWYQKCGLDTEFVSVKHIRMGGKSSNWKEVELSWIVGDWMKNRESMLCSGISKCNYIVESALYKDRISSTKLFDLVVRLKYLETH